MRQKQSGIRPVRRVASDGEPSRTCNDAEGSRSQRARFRNPGPHATLTNRMPAGHARTARRLAFAVAMLVGPSALAQQVPTPPPAAVVAPDPRYAQLPALTFRAINTREEVSVRLYRADGSVDSAVVSQLGHLLRDLATGESSPVVPRTLQLIVRVANHFGADTIEIVSGYRTGLNRDGHRVHREGYHSVGSAIDFRMPGQDMVRVAAFARTFSHAGVGWYPTSGFVHLDSREQSFCWENRAGHGHHGWDRPLERVSMGGAHDEAWTAEQDVPWDPPGAPIELVLHPSTAAGAHRPRHASRDTHHHHHRGGSTHRHLPLHVFRGE